MRDTFVLILFSLFIFSGTFLAYTGKVEPQLILTPIVTGFLGLLASTRPPPPPGPIMGSIGQKLGFSKPPPAHVEKEKKDD